jgi:tetratricopeptide (TPR) repeat protein
MLRTAFLIACVATATAAWADSNGQAPSVAQARKLYESGKAHYNLTEYREALEEFKGAYRARPDAVILFNIAQCYRMLAEFESAARYYRTFKREMPHDADGSAVDRLIAEMDRAAQERTTRQPPTGTKPPQETRAAAAESASATPAVVSTTPAAPAAGAVVAVARDDGPRSAAAPRPDPSPRGGVKTVAGATLAGVGVAALVVAVVEGVLAKNASDDINAAAHAMQPFDPGKQAAGQTDQAVSAALYGVGAAAVVGGAVLVFIGRRERARTAATTTTFAPQIGPRYAGATLETRF